MQHSELLQKVASEAANMKRGFSKENAFNIIQEKLGAGSSSFSEKELVLLYRHFLPAMPAKPKQAWQWVAKAMAKNDVRCHFNYMHVTGFKGSPALVATDGHRMHLELETEHGKEGQYFNQALDPIALDYTYPNIEQVLSGAISENTEFKAYANSKEWLASLPKGVNPKVKGNAALFAVYNGAAFNLKYLTDIVSLDGLVEITQNQSITAPLGFKFKRDNKTLLAVVMPLSLDAELINSAK